MLPNVVTQLNNKDLTNPSIIRGRLAKTHEWWDILRGDRIHAATERPPANLPMVYAYTAHTVELSRAVLDLHRLGRMFAALPIARSALECAMTAAWLAVTPDETASVLHAGAVERRKALKDIKRLGQGDVTAALDEVNQSLDELEGSASQPGHDLKARCDAILGGPDVYVTYRILSGLSHPSALLTDQYLSEAPETTLNPYGLAFRDAIRFDSDLETSHLGTVLCMVVTALIALDSTQPKPRIRSQLDKMTQQIGISRHIYRADGAASSEPGAPHAE